MDIRALWYDNISIDWWKMFLIGLFFLVMNACVFLAMWYVRRGIVMEYGYPKRNKKTIKKILKSYSFWDKLLLLQLTQNAERKGMFLYLNLICHYINITAFATSIGGFWCCMFTLADGWALTLLVLPELAVLLFTTIIEFIPQFVFLPSVRKRYK